MMLDFIFKYVWIAMLVIVYLIWSIVSIKNIIETVRRYSNLYYISPSSESWIIASIIITFLQVLDIGFLLV